MTLLGVFVWSQGQHGLEARRQLDRKRGASAVLLLTRGFASGQYDRIVRQWIFNIAAGLALWSTMLSLCLDPLQRQCRATKQFHIMRQAAQGTDPLDDLRRRAGGLGPVVAPCAALSPEEVGTVQEADLAHDELLLLSRLFLTTARLRDTPSDRHYLTPDDEMEPRVLYPCKHDGSSLGLAGAAARAPRQARDVSDCNSFQQ